MKTITLRYGKEKIQGRETFFSSLALLKSAVNNVTSQEGLTVDEMSKRLRLMEILDKNPEMDVEETKFNDELLLRTKDIELEDSDWEKLKTLFSGVKWMVLSKFIVDLDKDLKEAKSVEKN